MNPALKYHTKRYRPTCVGAGHVHCVKCDRALSSSREERQEYLRTDTLPQCLKCQEASHADSH